MENKTKCHVSNNSGNNEWYTPSNIIESARKVLGSIDTDPASCTKANETVQARTFWTKEDSGLEKSWFGNVWMNPPYSGSLVKSFSAKFLQEYLNGNTVQGFILVNNATETQWGNSLLSACNGVCFMKKRIKFLDIDNKPSGAPLQGQMLLYFGDSVNAFEQEFREYGVVFKK